MRVAPIVELSDPDREWLQKQARSGVAARRLGERCRIVLLAASGKTNEQIAEELGMTRQKAGRWRTRFVETGRGGIEADAPGRGRKPSFPPELRRLVVQKTTRETPPNATHWSLSIMAKALDVSPRTVGRIWHEHGLKPHLIRTFKVSNDPRFAEKLEDVIGLYLNAPEHAIVLCCDFEKPGAGAGSHPARTAAQEGARQHDDSRLCAPWHHDSLCRAQCRRR